MYTTLFGTATWVSECCVLRGGQRKSESCVVVAKKAICAWVETFGVGYRTMPTISEQLDAHKAIKAEYVPSIAIALSARPSCLKGGAVATWHHAFPKNTKRNFFVNRPRQSCRPVSSFRKKHIQHERHEEQGMLLLHSSPTHRRILTPQQLCNCGREKESRLLKFNSRLPLPSRT